MNYEIYYVKDDELIVVNDYVKLPDYNFFFINKV